MVSRIEFSDSFSIYSSDGLNKILRNYRQIE